MLTSQGSLAAPDAPPVTPLRLELNRLEPQANACRAYLLIDNAKGEALRSLKIDLFAMDTAGVAQKRIAVELGPLSAHKTSIKLFDFAGIDCKQMGRVLLNDVLSCAGPAGPREDCLAHIDTASRVGPVPFAK